MEGQTAQPAATSSDGQQNQTLQHPDSPATTDTDFIRDAIDGTSAAPLTSPFRSNAAPGTGPRASTPELADSLISGTGSLNLDATPVPRNSTAAPGSPRDIPGGTGRRRGIVFNDSFTDPSELQSSSPVAARSSPAQARPRTRTLDGALMAQRASLNSSDQRNRVGSISSSMPAAQIFPDEQKESSVLASASESRSYATPALPQRSIDTPSTPSSSRDKKARQRLLKHRQSSRPSSPVMFSAPSVDSMCVPVAAEDPNNLVSLMKTLCGRMRGEVEYQSEPGGAWYSGVAYIDEEAGSLMFDTNQGGSFHIPIVEDLRGCTVVPAEYTQGERQCIELTTSTPTHMLLLPAVHEDLELWLAALLSWQQLRPSPIKFANGKPGSPTAPFRPDLRPFGKLPDESKPRNIIKIDKLMLWDKGVAPNPRAAFQRSSTRDVWSPSAAWRRVSCILHDTGELTLMLETDSIVLSHIDLTQLSRHAIQQLDRTVLDEEFCIAIFPTYAPKASRVSVFRPVYLALDSRIHFEVWFVLLRAYAIPDLFHLGDTEDDELINIPDTEYETEGEVFRMGKVVSVRITEAKIKARPTGLEYILPEKSHKIEQDPLIGNYLAEVILDGEVRARTTTKSMTKNPFWREDCEFTDLAPSVQELSVVLKRIEGMDGSRGGFPQELICGTVHIALDQLERGQSHEDWLQIRDEKQQVIGSMLIRLSHDEHVALLTKEYDALSETLHRFPTGLTALISAALPGQLKQLSEIFLNIFQASGAASEWLLALVEDEIDGPGSQTSMKKYRFSSRLKSNESMESPSDRELIVRDMSKSLAGEANLLFRGNTLLTQSLEFHMRRLGKEYLEEALREKVFEINELNPDCEVDPSKLNGADLDQHWSQLIRITSGIWQCIAQTANRIPPELRHVLKYIRGVAEDRFGEFKRSATYTAVSGFLFLRFICPAILAPKLCGLLRDFPRARAQRTLTLVAKTLQKLSNLGTFGKREEYMEPMNRFLTSHRSVFREYIDQVCSIPSDRSVVAPPANYSTPNTISGRLTPTSREGLGSLPYLIDAPQSFASLVKLWTSARPNDLKTEQADGELLIFNELCMSLQKRVDACMAKVGRLRAAEAAARGTPSRLAETLEQAALAEPLRSPYSAAYTAMCHDVDQMLSGSGSDDGGSSRRRSKDLRRGRDGHDARKASGFSSRGTPKNRNGKVGRTLLSGIMKIGGRAESPDFKNRQ
ncbi:hypothetical protein LMH87_000207 [Akanthomyces muscarius]|uniref:Ras-GAP domain-containing protein n=2 Tax=Akanthomyces muscarius TaxID=2231603 RepID=A0A9W8QFR8_AKAMU|nr:hypothetical protein LMH87_000207 [Akanthomyces muscarius]KAJ4154936.1 hypothetical protein LMH87_000207 [Akanthomyces muscarius]